MSVGCVVSAVNMHVREILRLHLKAQIVQDYLISEVNCTKSRRNVPEELLSKIFRDAHLQLGDVNWFGIIYDYYLSHNSISNKCFWGLALCCAQLV